MLSQPITGYENIQLQGWINMNVFNNRNVQDFWYDGSSVASAPQTLTFTEAVSGTGSTVTFDQTDLTAPPGTMILTAGTTATGAALNNTRNQSMLLPSGEFEYAARFMLPILSDGTDTFLIRFGFGSGFTTSGDITNGIYAEYQHSIAGGAMRLRAASASVRTSVDGVTPLVAGAWHWLQIYFNARENYAAMYIDGNEEAILDSGFPTTSVSMGVNYGQIIKSAGVVARVLNVDAVFFGVSFANAR